MRQCKKEIEIELHDGTIVESTITVTEFVDDNFNGEGNPQSLVGEWKATHDEELDEEQEEEFNEQAEEIVFSEKWDWDNASDDDDDTEEEVI